MDGNIESGKITYIYILLCMYSSHFHKHVHTKNTTTFVRWYVYIWEQHFLWIESVPILGSTRTFVAMRIAGLLRRPPELTLWMEQKVNFLLIIDTDHRPHYQNHFCCIIFKGIRKLNKEGTRMAFGDANTDAFQIKLWMKPNTNNHQKPSIKSVDNVKLTQK